MTYLVIDMSVVVVYGLCNYHHDLNGFFIILLVTSKWNLMQVFRFHYSEDCGGLDDDAQ